MILPQHIFEQLLELNREFYAQTQVMLEEVERELEQAKEDCDEKTAT